MFTEYKSIVCEWEIRIYTLFEYRLESYFILYLSSSSV